MTQPSETDIKQAETTLTGISDLATNIKTLSEDALEHIGANDLVAAQLSSISHMASLAGYYADLAEKKLSGGPGCMSTEQWLCSPRYNDLTKQDAATAVHLA